MIPFHQLHTPHEFETPIKGEMPERTEEAGLWLTVVAWIGLVVAVVLLTVPLWRRT